MEKDLELIDKLLRKRARALGDSVQCSGFDLDQAGAYLEKALNEAEQTRFEAHLGDCPACRKQMTEFMRAFGETFDPLPEQITELAPIAPVQTETDQPAKETDSGVAGILGWLTGSPWRWAMTLVLIGLMAGTSWFIAKHKNIEQIANDQPTTPKNSPQNPQGGQLEQQQNTPPVVANNSSTPTPSPVPNLPGDNKTQPEQQPNLPDTQVANQTPQQPGNVNQNNQKPGSDNAPINLPPQVKPENPINDVAIDDRPKLAPPTINPQLPPPPPVEDNKGGTELAQGTPNNKIKTPNQDIDQIGNINIPSLSSVATKKVGDKTFKMVQGIWTDEQYLQSGKGLPQVTLSYGGAEYQQAIKENNGLQTYAKVGTKVRVVFNGKVYNINRK